MKWISGLVWPEDGATAVEYAVMMALIVAVIIGSVLAMSNAAADSFQNSAEQIEAVM